MGLPYVPTEIDRSKIKTSILTDFILAIVDPGKHILRFKKKCVI